MYKFLLIPLLSTILLATNPKPYSALGDVIYNNIEKIEKLKSLDTYKLYTDEIDAYIKKVEKTKEDGFLLEKKSPKVSKKGYLNSLRELSKENDYYLRAIKNSYKESMEKNNYTLFSNIINSELIDTQKHKDEIIDYYYKHKLDINASGVIENFLLEDAALKARKDAQRKKQKTKKELEAEKIKRLREKDRLEQERLEKRLQENLKKKKEEIREKQKEELAN